MRSARNSDAGKKITGEKRPLFFLFGRITRQKNHKADFCPRVHSAAVKQRLFTTQ
jgi:hypothetical protein